MEHPLVRELVSAKASTSREALSNSSSKTASSSTSEGSNSIGEYRVCNGDRSSSSRISREGSKLLNGGSHSSSAASSQGVRIALVFGVSAVAAHPHMRLYFAYLHSRMVDRDARNLCRFLSGHTYDKI